MERFFKRLEKLFRSRDKNRGRNFEGQRASRDRHRRSLDDNHVPRTSKKADPPSFYQSLPASLDNVSHIGENNQTVPQDVERTTPIGLSSQPMNAHLVSSSHSMSSTLTPNPWETWTLDLDFFNQVYMWNSEHPECKLDRVVHGISNAIEQHSELLEMVPDGPIPIRGFVKALAHIVQLGITMAEAKVAALQFAQDILQWVEQLADAFSGGEGGHLTSMAWKNLNEIRKLIENVCTWARRMLTIPLYERASVNGQIANFQKEFSEAVERFGATSLINLAKGQDTVIRGMHSFNMDMNRRLEAISSAQHDPLQMSQLPLPDATHWAQKKLPCDRGTREKLLKTIMTWISDTSDDSFSLFWLSGDPGVGKSAITASIAKECRDQGVLWAEFFINRNDAQTMDPKLYFPSIAKQMSTRSPSVENVVRETIEARPSLLKDDISDEQATLLFVKIIRVASKVTTGPIAIIIDALDESDTKRLKLTAEVFSHLLDDLPHNVKVFISSRVENVIRDEFADHPRIKNVHLSAKNSVTEVTKFLKMKVQEIMTEYRVNFGDERTRKLCSQASGLFIWAVTAIKFIRNEIEESGKECLDVVLDELNASGMDDINSLYLTIIKRVYRREADPWTIQRFRRIIGAILVQQTPLSIQNLQGLLDLKNPKTGAPVDIEHFVRRLRTVLVSGVGEISGQTIPRVHKSFADFITGPKAMQFQVDMIESNGELALCCINQLLHFQRGKIPQQLQYSVLHWSSHLTHVVEAPVESSEETNDTASVSDTQSLSSNAERDLGVSAASEPEPRTKEMLSDVHGVSCMATSPDRTRIVYTRASSILLRRLETGNPIANTLMGHTDDVMSVAFSSDGTRIISASDDCTIRIWDASTGAHLMLLEGHTGRVLSAAFSSDGTRIVSASADDTIRIWDATTGAQIMVLEGHANPVMSAAFSSDGTRIVSASYDETIRIWDASTGAQLMVLKGHTHLVASATFSSDGTHIVSASHDKSIRIWDVTTGTQVADPLVDHGSLSLTGSQSNPYINTPQNYATAPETGLSYHAFRVAENGWAVGIADNWFYLDITAEQLVMFRSYQGLLDIQDFW